MVMHVQAFQFYFPDYLTELTLKEFGRPPYPKYLQSLLTDDFLCLLTEPELVSVPSISSETTSVLASAPKSEESSVVIKWDDQQSLIELIHPFSELAPSSFVSPPIVADSAIMSAPRAAARPAPTENERCLAQTDGLNEPNFACRALPEPLPIVRFHLIPFRPLERLEDILPIIESTPQTALITDNHMPLYNAHRYAVHHLTATFAHLSFMLTPEPRFHHHRNAHLTHHSETEGIPM